MDADDGQLLPSANKGEQQGLILQGEVGNGGTPRMMKVRGISRCSTPPPPLHDGLHRGSRGC